MEMRKIFVVVFIFLATTIFAKHSDVFLSLTASHKIICINKGFLI